MAEKNYDSTIMRIAGNLLSGMGHELEDDFSDKDARVLARNAVRLARAIVAEVQKSALPESP